MGKNLTAGLALALAMFLHSAPSEAHFVQPPPQHFKLIGEYHMFNDQRVPYAVLVYINMPKTHQLAINLEQYRQIHQTQKPPLYVSVNTPGPASNMSYSWDPQVVDYAFRYFRMAGQDPEYELNITLRHHWPVLGGHMVKTLLIHTTKGSTEAKWIYPGWNTASAQNRFHPSKHVVTPFSDPVLRPVALNAASVAASASATNFDKLISPWNVAASWSGVESNPQPLIDFVERHRSKVFSKIVEGALAAHQLTLQNLPTENPLETEIRRSGVQELASIYEVKYVAKPDALPGKSPSETQAILGANRTYFLRSLGAGQFLCEKNLQLILKKKP